MGLLKGDRTDGEKMYVSFLWIAFFVALTVVGGAIRIPAFPVPFTLQTMFVYLAGDLMGGKRAAVSQMGFLLLGLIGFPVFSMGGGFGYIFQPTFGYLLSFPLSAWIIGILGSKNVNHSWWNYMVANSLGGMIILFVGACYLYLNLKYIVQKPIQWTDALSSGLLLFLPAEVLKLTMAAVFAKRLMPILLKENYLR